MGEAEQTRAPQVKAEVQLAVGRVVGRHKAAQTSNEEENMYTLAHCKDKEEIIENYKRLTDAHCDELCALIKAGTVKKIALAHNDIS